MPSTPFDTLLAATMDTRGPEIHDQVFTSQPLLAKMKANGQIKPWDAGGENIEFILETSANDTFAARDYKDALDFKEANPLEVVELPSRFINGSITYYDWQVESNQGKGKVVDLVEKLMANATKQAKTVLAMELWQEGTREHLHGIPAIFDHDNTYMGKDRLGTGMAYWKSRTSDAGHPSFTQSHADGTSITYGPYHTSEPLVVEGGTDQGISKLYDDLCDNGGTDGPDFAITANFLYRKLCVIAKAFGFGYNEKMAELGYPENLQYRNMTIVWDWNANALTAGVFSDNSATVGPFIAMSTKALELKPYKGYDSTFKSTPVFKLHSQGILASSVIMQWRGNLGCVNPQKTGALTAKTV